MAQNFANSSNALSLPPATLCHNCVISMFRQKQSTPYSNYGVRMASDWSAIQKICNISYPTSVPKLATNVTNLPLYASPGTVYSTKCASGKTYKVVSGDNCNAIALKQNVSTGALIGLNNLLPGCTNLLAGQVRTSFPCSQPSFS